MDQNGQVDRRGSVIRHRTFTKLPGSMIDDLLERRDRLRLQVEDYIRTDIGPDAVLNVTEASDNNGFTITVWYRSE